MQSLSAAILHHIGSWSGSAHQGLPAGMHTVLSVRHLITLCHHINNVSSHDAIALTTPRTLLVCTLSFLYQASVYCTVVQTIQPCISCLSLNARSYFTVFYCSCWQTHQDILATVLACVCTLCRSATCKHCYNTLQAMTHAVIPACGWHPKLIYIMP